MIHGFLNYISTHSGTGLIPEYMTHQENKNIDYIYWDDPNELVDRLRLILASQAAGNPSHNNEILSIIEEFNNSVAKTW